MSPYEFRFGCKPRITVKWRHGNPVYAFGDVLAAMRVPISGAEHEPWALICRGTISVTDFASVEKRFRTEIHVKAYPGKSHL